METKQCTKCKEVKGFDCFHKESRGKNGLRASCKECRKKYSKKYCIENKKRISVRHKKYKQENKEKIFAWTKKYNEENKKRIAVRTKKYNEENKKRIAVRAKKYSEENKERIAVRAKKYYQENKAEVLGRKEKVRGLLKDSYIIGFLKEVNSPITPELIELKRITVKINRLIKQRS
jgi:hypothetical protein